MDYESRQSRADSNREEPDDSGSSEPLPVPHIGEPVEGRVPLLRALGPRTLRAWLILGASLALALAIYYGFLGSSLVEPVAAWTASWTSKAMNLLGGSTRVSGTILISENFAANIVAECTAVGPLVLFIGAVVAYPAPLVAKALGAAIGLIVLTSVNLVRIMSLVWIGSSYPEYLDMAHLLVWQSAIILLAIVMWLIWAERVAGARKI